MSTTRIGLIDANNFFVSCERLFRPDLIVRPVIVLSSNDGCVVSRSEEAKALGIPMGEPYFKVRDLCETNGVAVFSSNFDLYRDLSRRVVEVIRRYSDSIETYSVDESFVVLDQNDGVLYEQATHIRNSVFRETGIPVAVGVARTKTLAKVATHFAKPKRGGNGVVVLEVAEEEARALSMLPVGDVWGIGRRLAPRLTGAGVRTAADLKDMSDARLRKTLSVTGLRTAYELRGICCFEVGEEPELRKSLLHSQSFGEPVRDLTNLISAVTHHARKVAEILRAEHAIAHEVAILVRTSRYTKDQHHTFVKEVLPMHTNDTLILVQVASQLARRIFRTGMSYRKAGVYVSDIIPDGAVPEQTLFGEPTGARKALMNTLDTLRHRFGDVVRIGSEGLHSPWKARHTLRSPRYTTRWRDIPSI